MVEGPDPKKDKVDPLILAVLISQIQGQIVQLCDMILKTDTRINKLERQIIRDRRKEIGVKR